MLCVFLWCWFWDDYSQEWCPLSACGFSGREREGNNFYNCISIFYKCVVWQVLCVCSSVVLSSNNPYVKMVSLGEASPTTFQVHVVSSSLVKMLKIKIRTRGFL